MLMAEQLRWICCPRSNPWAELRLFCFPFAGGGASVFRPWQEALCSEVEVCAIQLPGRETRLSEPPVTSMRSLARAATDAISSSLDRPFVLFGHSMGALLAFEVARELRRRGRRSPELLVASGHRAPQLPDPDPPLHVMPECELLDAVRRFQPGAAVAAHVELLQTLLPILRADFTACETYEYYADRILECPISVFGGVDDPAVEEEGLRAWHQQTASEFSIELVPGDHFFVKTADFVRLLDSRLAQVLEQSGRWANS